ncbi:MAG TPA: citrate synthase [Polyangiales bacterium]
MTGVPAVERAESALRDGLEGVVVAETLLSEVDGERGRLIIAGFDVEQLAARHGFEHVVSLLWKSSEGLSERDARTALGQARARAFERLPRLGDALEREQSMDALRAAFGHLPEDSSASDLVGALGVFACAWAQRQRGVPPIAPDPALTHAADIVRMLGLGHDAARASALDTYLVTVSDHGLNASTFAARVVASTGSDRVSALVAALGALKGPLHGGAPGPVLDMLDQIATAAQAPALLAQLVARGERIMGMGHRIYRVRDPRALTLERAVEQLGRALAQREADGRAAAGGSEDARVRERLALARAVEHAAETLLNAHKPGRRPLRANVEFYTAVLLEAIGIPRALFTPLFAAARSAGWIAHVAEQKARGRLIRPASRYVGSWPAQP